MSGDRLDKVRQDLDRSIAATALENLTRRNFIGRIGTGVGAMALAALASETGLSQAFGAGLDLRMPHHAPKARRIIYVHMAGAPRKRPLRSQAASCPMAGKEMS